MMNSANRHILITDDNPTNIILLDRLIQRMGHRTTHAETGEEAIRLLERDTFDLVLLDIMLPGMTGFQVLEWIRERHSLDSLPVIMVSALTDESSIIQGLQLGANDYVTKPINVDVVQLRVETQLKLKQAIEEQAFVAQQLQKSNDMQNRLMRIASHDLKNPISNVAMSLQLIEQIHGKDELMDLAIEQLATMETIIHEFLEQELIKNDSLLVECQSIRYDDVLASVLMQYQQAANAKGITIESNLSNQMIMADRSRLEQAISNLVSNAIKYATPNTTVIINELTENDVVRLHIQNIGECIPSEEIGMLFQPFSKLTPRPTAGEHSSGLGLWIVQQMIEAQGGSVGINSQVTDGAEFWIELPRHCETMSKGNTSMLVTI